MKHTKFAPVLVLVTMGLGACDFPSNITIVPPSERPPPTDGTPGTPCPMVCKIPAGTYDEYICHAPLKEEELARVVVIHEDWQRFHELRVKKEAGDAADTNVPVVDMYESWGHSRWFRGEGWSLEIPLGPEPANAPPGYTGNLSTLTRPDGSTRSMQCEYKNNVPCESVCGQ